MFHMHSDYFHALWNLLYYYVRKLVFLVHAFCTILFTPIRYAFLLSFLFCLVVHHAYHCIWNQSALPLWLNKAKCFQLMLSKIFYKITNKDLLFFFFTCWLWNIISLSSLFYANYYYICISTIFLWPYHTIIIVTWCLANHYWLHISTNHPVCSM